MHVCRDRGDIGPGIYGLQKLEVGPQYIVCMYSLCFIMSSSYRCYIRLVYITGYVLVIV